MAFGAFANTGPDLAAAAPRRRSYVALFLLLPGVVYLLATFVAPLVSLVLTSFKEPGGTFDVGEYVYAFRWENYAEAISRFGEIFVRTFGYSATATILALLISYPLAYFIGVTLRRYPLWQSLTLILVIAPFFISFLLRTLALKAIFADEGPVVGVLQSLGILGPSDYLNGTAFTVIFGLTYNYIPFMTLPIYASLERLDLRYVEAGGDLYAGPAPALLAHHPAAVASRRRVRDPADLHPRLRRLRQRQQGLPRLDQHRDGRKRHQRPVLPERLPAVRGASRSC